MPFKISTKPVKVVTLKQKNFYFLHNNDIIKAKSQDKQDCGKMLIKLALAILSIYQINSKMSRDKILEKIIKWLYFGKIDKSLEKIFLPQRKNDIPVWYTGFNHSEIQREKLSEYLIKVHGYKDTQTQFYTKLNKKYPGILDEFDDKCGGMLRLNSNFWNGYSQIYTIQAMEILKQNLKKEMKSIVVFIGIEPDDMHNSYFFKEELQIIKQMNKNGIPIYMFNTKNNCKEMETIIQQKFNININCIDCNDLDECLAKASVHFKFKSSG